MLRFEFTDINDNVLQMYNPLALSINMEQGVPADDMVVQFELCECDELKDIVVYDDTKVVFTGIVDEQQRIVQQGAQVLKIVARSMAAMLLDNESIPISYTHPSAEVISSRHAVPFGVKLKGAQDVTYFGTQTVYKGDTNWQTVEDFAKNNGYTSPRVNECGELILDAGLKDERVVFSNRGDGVRYTSCVENTKRCEEISCVRIKVSDLSGYNLIIDNPSAKDRQIKRERCLNAVFTDTPVAYAQRMINNSKRKSYTVTLECPGQHLGAFLCDAQVADRQLNYADGLYVCSVRYRFDKTREVTTVTLRRKEV